MDSYLSISEIANDEWVNERMRAAATQQVAAGNVPEIAGYDDPGSWVAKERYLWASSPGWGAAWDSALAAHPDEPDYEPGRDQAVITDGMILSTVQALGT